MFFMFVTNVYAKRKVDTDFGHTKKKDTTNWKYFIYITCLKEKEILQINEKNTSKKHIQLNCQKVYKIWFNDRILMPYTILFITHFHWIKCLNEG